MKTRFYILLILLLSFSLAHAQKNSTEIKVVTVNELNVNPVSKFSFSNEIHTELFTVKELNASNEVIARSSSDIRIYLNKERNIENIKLLFPKIYKKIIA